MRFVDERKSEDEGSPIAWLYMVCPSGLARFLCIESRETRNRFWPCSKVPDRGICLCSCFNCFLSLSLSL